jgi:transposase
MHLPRCEQVLEPETIACPCCQGQLHKIGEDISEVLDIIPAILRVAADDLSQVRLQQLHRWRDPGEGAAASN